MFKEWLGSIGVFLLGLLPLVLFGILIFIGIQYTMSGVNKYEDDTTAIKKVIASVDVSVERDNDEITKDIVSGIVTIKDSLKFEWKTVVVTNDKIKVYDVENPNFASIFIGIDRGASVGRVE